MRKKGQIGLMETIAVLFIFIVLVLVGFVFYFGYQRTSIAQLGEEFRVQRALDISWRTSFLPELLCSREQTVPTDCFDKLKLIEAKEEFNESRDLYFDLFGFSEVYVETYYPEEEKFVVYNYTAGNATRKSRKPNRFPLTVYDPITDRYNFGVLHVFVYS